MSDYRNFDFRNPDDPYRNDPKLDPNVRTPNQAWGWVAAAVFLVIVLAVAFGYGHGPGQPGTNTASNDVMPPAAIRMAPPGAVRPPATVPPTTSVAPNTAPPTGTPSVTGTPNSPAPLGSGH